VRQSPSPAIERDRWVATDRWWAVGGEAGEEGVASAASSQQAVGGTRGGGLAEEDGEVTNSHHGLSIKYYKK
jgi:hypothetical protein